MKSSCCNGNMQVESGYYCCVECGRVCSPALFLSTQSHSHFTGDGIVRYSRYRRAVNLINKLCGSGPQIDPIVIMKVKARHPKTPSDVFAALHSLKERSLPYDQCSKLLFYCTGKKSVIMSPSEKILILTQFKILYDYWLRFKTQRWFPFFFLFRKFLSTTIVRKRLGADRAAILKTYIRPLKCLTRQVLYTQQFCYLVGQIENGMEKSLATLFKLPDIRDSGVAQTITKWTVPNA